MSWEDRRTKIKRILTDSYKEAQTQIREFRQELIKQALDTMRSAVVFAVAVATGALVLLSTNTPAERTLVVLGVVILLLGTVIIFGLLVHFQRLYLQRFLLDSHETLSPISKMLLLVRKSEKGELSELEFFKQVEEIGFDFEEGVWKPKLESDTQPNNGTDRSDLIIILILGTGTLFIVIGLVYPYII